MVYGPERAEPALLPLAWRSEAAPGTHLIVRSQNHISPTLEWRGRGIVTAGAVSLPLDVLTRAQFCPVTLRKRWYWALEHHSVRCDVVRLSGAFTAVVI